MADKATRRALDFTNVKEGGGINPVHVEDGDYRAKIIEVRDEKVKNGTNAGEPSWNFVFQLVDRRSATYPYRCTLVENQLWKVRNVLIAAGKVVPKKRVNVDPNNVVGIEVGITLESDEYEGKMKSEITAVFPVAELAEDDGDADAGDAELPADDADDEGDLDLDDL